MGKNECVANEDIVRMKSPESIWEEQQTLQENNIKGQKRVIV